MSKNTTVNKSEEVDEYMKNLDHPLKKEAQAIREIIKDVNSKIIEQVKWNAPSFSYKEYMVTFNLRNKNYVHLVFHNGAILHDNTRFLEGDYVDRRMAYFHNMKEVEEKKHILQNLIEEWIKIMDR